MYTVNYVIQGNRRQEQARTAALAMKYQLFLKLCGISSYIVWR